jgi:predicted amidohydrolase
VCSGLVERAGDQVFNSAVILDRRGKLLLLHRKLNELTIGHEYYAQGDRLNVCHTELGTLGLMICADGFAHNQVLTHARDTWVPR